MRQILLAVCLLGAMGGQAFADIAPDPKPSGCGGGAHATSAPAAVGGALAGVVTMAILLGRRRARQRREGR